MKHNAAKYILEKKQAEINKLKGDIAHAIGFCQGVGYPERYLEKEYPELVNK